MIDCTAIVLTYNEELNIEKCIHSILGFCKRIVIIDSFSSDRTLEIASNFGCEIIKHKFENHSKQFEFGVNEAKVETEWILRLDADECLSDDAKKEILSVISNSKVTGVIIPFEITFLGKKLKHGGVYPVKKLILFKKNLGHIEQKNMDEHIVVRDGVVKKIKSISYHNDNKDLKTWLLKHVNYVFREAEDAENYLGESKIHENNKKRVFYYRLPSCLRARLYFIYRYYFRFGFLDGKPGKYYALLQAYFYRVAVDAALYEKKIRNNR